ncbi:hypothetical protein JAAARDRAFT_211412 [Jaapia argillacea MUCL 33604]|uniref:Uncharacterized protein n=1 Tax=Jaapia argillacea MUCL 33604 TaxID=933084 RepID=A0A067PAZ4_9AGAM|nr:hypothetical protein JAAARDRAFT_211412 [Jaapia argillacea MUCL 33604]
MSSEPTLESTNNPSTPSLSNLPTELLLEIIYHVLGLYPDQIPRLDIDVEKYTLPNSWPSSLLTLNSSFDSITQHLLYTHLRFRSTRQLQLFARRLNHLTTGGHKLPYPPKTISVTLAGATADFYVYVYLRDVLLTCLGHPPYAESNGSGEVSQNSAPGGGKLELDALRLCFNSYASHRIPSHNMELIRDALSLVDAKTFMWTGPDPDHHFSTAIVPAATSYLFDALSTWSSLTHLKLTNIAFPFPFNNESPEKPFLPPLPLTVRTIYIGQATALPPIEIAAMVFRGMETGLEAVRIVDGYSGSIWGPRLRRSFVEAAAAPLIVISSGLGEAGGGGIDVGMTNLLVDAIRRVVRCEAKNDRIMGGDRADGSALLE